jgi:hypothetical protein
MRRFGQTEKAPWREAVAQKVTLCCDTESLAAGLEGLDRTDEDDSHQENEGGEKGVDDHNRLLKNWERGVQAGRQRRDICFQ